MKKSIVFIILILVILFSVSAYGNIVRGMILKDSNLVSPIEIDIKTFESGQKVSLGERFIKKEVIGTIVLNWEGNSTITISCISKNGNEEKYPIIKNEKCSFPVNIEDIYTISIKNTGLKIIENLRGTITFEENKNSMQSVISFSDDIQAIVYDNVKMRFYESGLPYIHEIKTNHTDKKIIGFERGMLAYDKNGQPLEIDWFSLDSDVDKSYHYLYDWNSSELSPGETEDNYGGWTLNCMGKDSSVEKIAYVLYCDKSITFEDGTVWENPDYDSWLNIYKGKFVSVETLKNYYPFVQEIIK